MKRWGGYLPGFARSSSVSARRRLQTNLRRRHEHDGWVADDGSAGVGSGDDDRASTLGRVPCHLVQRWDLRPDHDDHRD
jgi:hypothetical protein